MSKADRRRVVALLVAASLTLPLAALAAGSLLAGPTAQAGDVERGRRLYRTGEGAGGPLVGAVGDGSVELRGALVACANCHGARGEGSFRGEAAPPLEAKALFQPAAADASGRGARPAYDEARLARALRDGVAADGRRLSGLMPRFAIDDADLADLLAWLRVLGTRPEAGIESERIVVGSVLPSTGRLAGLGADVERVLRAALADAGAIYGRRVELVVEDAADPEAVEKLAARPVFALVGSVRNGARPSDALLERERLALVGPVGFSPREAESAPSIFWIYPGPAQLARWAVQRLAEEGVETMAIVAASDEASRLFAESARDEADRLLLDVRELDAAAAAASRRDALLYAGDAAELIELASEAPPTVSIVAPGGLALPALAGSGVADRIRFVHPLPIGKVGARFRAFAARHGLADRNAFAQATAWASAQLLIEALRRAGAEPTRERFLEALESIRSLETGVTPPITWGPRRRLGVGGARFVRLEADGDFAAASDWHPLAAW